jgi:hypothetical protein
MPSLPVEFFVLYLFHSSFLLSLSLSVDNKFNDIISDVYIHLHINLSPSKMKASEIKFKNGTAGKYYFYSWFARKTLH